MEKEGIKEVTIENINKEAYGISIINSTIEEEAYGISIVNDTTEVVQFYGITMATIKVEDSGHNLLIAP